MKEADVRRRAFAMPLTNPAYPIGPYRFYNREYLIITYRTNLEPQADGTGTERPARGMAGDQFFCFAPRPQAAKKRAKPLKKTGRSAIARHGRLWPDRPPWHAIGAAFPDARIVTHDLLSQQRPRSRGEEVLGLRLPAADARHHGSCAACAEPHRCSQVSNGGRARAPCARTLRLPGLRNLLSSIGRERSCGRRLDCSG